LGFIALVSSLLGLTSAAAAATTITGGNVGGQTWTFSGSPYIITGDVTVQTGTTLTIQSAVQIQFAGSDSQHGGMDPARIELTVNGRLIVNGTFNSAVTFGRQNGTSGNWYGIVIGPTAFGATLTGFVLHDAQTAITSSMTNATLSVSTGTIANVAVDGVRILAGALSLDSFFIEADLGAAVSIEGSSGDALIADVVNCILVSSVPALSIDSQAKVTATLTNCSLDQNTTGALVASAATGSSLAIKNSIFTNNTNGAVVNQAGAAASVTLTYSDLWTNGTATGSVTPGTGCIAANPNFYSAVDYDLVAPSPCIDSGTATGAPDHDYVGVARPVDGDGVGGPGFDMGALEYVPTGGTGGSGGAGGTGGTGGTTGTGGSGGASGAGGSSGGKGGASGAGGTGGAGGSSGAGGSAGVSGAGGTSGAGGQAGAGGGLGGRGGTSGAGGQAGAGGSSGGKGGSGGVGGQAGAASGAGGQAGVSGGAGGVAGSVGTGGSAGTSGSAGTGGSAGTTGAAGTSGAAGTGGSIGTSGTAGTSGAAGTSGTAGRGGAGGTTGTGGVTGTNAPGNGGGCSCATGGPPMGSASLLVFAALLVTRRRRRKR
jgi:uncharacterized membrane protein YgcG